MRAGGGKGALAILCCLAAASLVLGLWLLTSPAERLATPAEAPQPVEAAHEEAGAAATESAGDHANDGDAASGDAPEGETPSDQISPAGGGGQVSASPSVGGDYDQTTVLVSLREGTTAEEAEALLASVPGVVAREVSAEELATGLLEVELTSDGDIEEALESLQAAASVEVAQPNYYYYELLGDEGDLRVRFEDEADGAGTAPAGVPGASGEPAPGASEVQGEESEAGDRLEPSDPDTTQVSSQMGGEVVGEAGAPSTGDAGEGAAPALSQMMAAGESDAAGEADAEGAADLVEALDVNDPYSRAGASTQWALASMHVFEAWSKVRCEGTVAVAVLDNHPDVAHEDLTANVAATYDAHTDSDDLGTPAEHGTHVAGIVSGVAGNGIGVAGVSYNADLVVVNVFHESTSSPGSGRMVTDTKTLCRAYAYLMAHADEWNLRVVNLSFGGKRGVTSDDLLVKSMEEAYGRGILTVAAAGNSDLATVPYEEYPGDAKHVVSVINLRRSSAGVVSRNSSSNYNVSGQRTKNLSAPGTDIYSTASGGSYTKLSGTSMAAPQVAGVLALEFAANPGLAAPEAMAVLYDTAADLGDDGWDETYGYGEVDALAAVEAARDPQRVAEALARIEEASASEAPDPHVSGPTRMPAGAKASFQVRDGSLELRAGEGATLSGTTLSVTSAGTVTLAVLDSWGFERSTIEVEVYDTPGLWTLASAANDACVLDVAGGSLADGGNVQLHTDNGTRAQSWLLEGDGRGTFVLRCGKTGKALDVSGGSVGSGANVQQHHVNGTDAQRWELWVDAENRVTLVNAKSAKALEVAGGTAVRGSNVVQGVPTDALTQKWVLRASPAEQLDVFEGIYRVESCLGSSLVLDVSGGSTAAGANVQVWGSNGSVAQRWRLDYVGEGAYRLTNVGSGRVLDVAGGRLTQDANIQQWGSNGSAAQRFEFSPAQGGYTILRAGTTWAVDVAGGRAVRGTNVRQHTANGTVAQRWRLVQY